MVFDRFDVEHDKANYAEMFDGKEIMVGISGGDKEGATLLDIFRNGGILASTERRRIMGARKNVGMSEDQDMTSGGAKSTFVRLHHKGTHADADDNQIIWDDPLTLLRRSDWYGAPMDTYGAENPKWHGDTSLRTTNLATVANFGSGNEIMFRDGLDLLGVDAPSRILCATEYQRDDLMEYLHEQGITKIGDKPISKVIKAIYD
jgi:hypothetical protein